MPAGSNTSGEIRVVAAGECSAHEMAAHSLDALDAPLGHGAELAVGVLRDEALLLGAFQRGGALPDRWPVLRRSSGGPEVRVGPGSVYVALSLASPGAAPLFADARKIVNRAVRPLLRALTRTGCTAQFFGRDWVAVHHRPAAWVGFAHDATTERTVFEGFVAVRVPFAIEERASFRGRPQATLESLAAGPVDPLRLAAAIAEAYAEGYDARAAEGWGRWSGRAPPAEEDLRGEPPWAATCEEAIGIVGAGPDRRGVFRIGGDLLASRDALARLEASVAAASTPSCPDEAIGRMVDAAFASPRVALDGVRSLSSIRDVIARALRRPAAEKAAP